MALARAYFALQGLAGGVWWAFVFSNSTLRHATLGGLPLELAWIDLPLFVVGSLLAATGGRFAVWVVLVWTALVTGGMFLYATATREAAWGAIAMTAALGGTTAASAMVLLGHVPTEWLIRGPFVFRTTSDTRGHLSRTIRQLLAFWTVFLVVLPLGLVSLERRWGVGWAFPPSARLAGLALFVAMSALGIASSLVMTRRGEGTPLPATMAKRLVVEGPYRYVRNPMAIAGIGQGFAVGLALGSWTVVLYALGGSLLWNWAIRPHEEADLARRFGTEFEEYRNKVSCWWPKRYAPR